MTLGLLVCWTHTPNPWISLAPVACRLFSSSLTHKLGLPPQSPVPCSCFPGEERLRPPHREGALSVLLGFGLLLTRAPTFSTFLPRQKKSSEILKSLENER